MNKKIITGAVIALAAGIAAYIYNRRKNSVSYAAENAYDSATDFINNEEQFFS
jgi:hypothetical protein